MKSNTRKKLLALFAASTLAVAGVAWAAVSTGTLTGTTATQTGDMNATGSVPATPTAGYNLGDDTVNWLGGLTLPVVANSTTSYTTVSNLGAIVLDDGQVLNLKPGEADAATPALGRVIGRAATVASGVVGGVGTEAATSGKLRLNGGTTNLYAGNDNTPTTAANMNNYDGGTFLMAGRLNVAHSNALGLGPLTLGHNTTFGVIDTSNLELAAYAPDNTALLNPGALGVSTSVAKVPGTSTNANTSAFAGSLGTAVVNGLYHQTVTVRRHDNAAANGVQNTRPVTFDVPNFQGITTELKLHAGILQPLASVNPGGDFSAVQLVKTGEGTMIVDSAGTQHTGGTHVREGKLFVDGGRTLLFAGELGNTWLWTGESPVELSSPKINYNNYLEDRRASSAEGDAWGERQNVLNETDARFTPASPILVAPAYMNSFATAQAQVTGGGYVNPLTIDAAALVEVNRSQFIGDLNGAGSFVFTPWVKGNEVVIPQLTLQLNNTLSTNGGANADFSGNITGQVNLVLDNPVQATGAGVDNGQRFRRVNFFPRIQALTGTNDIKTGDTFIKDGTLSVNKASNISPETLRIGMYDAGYTTGPNGVTAGSANFRGFGPTLNIATFHGLDDMIVGQQTLVYAPGMYVGGALGNDGTSTALPNVATRSVTWYGNNPENIANPAATDIVGTDGRYNAVGPYVNLAATRGKTVGFSDIRLAAQNGAIPTIAQFSGKNYIRYNMANAMAVNDKLDENPMWDGTVAFVNSWDLTGATTARMFGFDVKAGTLRLEKVQQGGYALVGLRQGATLALGNEARDFGDDMQIVFEDDARICVTPQTTDLVRTYDEARGMEPVFMADSINYTGLGSGTEHTSKYLVVQLDLSNIGTDVTDQWIKVVGSHNAPNWTNIHIRQAGNDQGSHQYKVKVAQPGNAQFDQNYSVTPFCDENMYNIYVHIKKLDQPVTPTTPVSEDQTMVTPGANVPATLAQNAAVAIPFTVSADLYDVNTVAVVTTPDAGWTVEAIDRAAGSFQIVGTMPANAVSYVVTATSRTDGATYKSAPYSMALTTPATGSSSGGGCDAGFGAFALLAIAGAAVLRKKD